MASTVKRTYNLQPSTVKRVREMAERYGIAASQDAVVELAVAELERRLREARETEAWEAAAGDTLFRNEAAEVEASYRSADRETWPASGARSWCRTSRFIGPGSPPSAPSPQPELRRGTPGMSRLLRARPVKRETGSSSRARFGRSRSVASDPLRSASSQMGGCVDRFGPHSRITSASISRR